MDDYLSQPSLPPPRESPLEDDEDSGDEDAGPDWMKFSTSSKPSLPKRGDKEFEPASSGPTNLQKFSLDRAREAMFSTLSTERGISDKSVSYAIWYPELARAHVTRARGVVFNGMGHSVARAASSSSSSSPKAHKRTELLPEEALYLIERGNLFCWKDEPAVLPLHAPATALGETDMQGSPMSVQQAFAEIVGKDDLTLERYQEGTTVKAFAYLKRLGFNVIRAKPPSAAYPTPPPLSSQDPKISSFLLRVFGYFSALWRRLLPKVNWWKPVNLHGWLGCARNYASVYRTLRLIPSGHSAPLRRQESMAPTENPTPYEIFYHVYKPNTPFKKSAPPSPDFSLVVVDARTTPLPTIHELTHLWSFLPETGPPPQRQRHAGKPSQNLGTSANKPQHVPETSGFLSKLFFWSKPRNIEKSLPARKPHPFAVLKAGKKVAVIGVVDRGTIGFFRFGMGAFEEMPIA